MLLGAGRRYLQGEAGWDIRAGVGMGTAEQITSCISHLPPSFSSKTLQLIIFAHGARAAVKWLLISLGAAGCYRV